MKKSDMMALVNYLTEKNDASMMNIRNNLAAELARGEEKARVNRDLYATAHDVAMNVLTDTPVSVADWFALSNDWPEGFTKSKLQYAVREYWADEVIKIEGKVNMYKKA